VLDLQVEDVAEVGRLLRQHAVAEHPGHGRVLALQRELQLCGVLLWVLEMAHGVLPSSGRIASMVASTSGPSRRTPWSGSAATASANCGSGITSSSGCSGAAGSER